MAVIDLKLILYYSHSIINLQTPVGQAAFLKKVTCPFFDFLR